MIRTKRIRRNSMAGRGRWALIGVLGGTVVLAATLLAQSKPRTPAAAQSGSRARTAAASAEPRELKAADRKPLSYYTSGVRTDLFGSPPPPPPVVRPEPPAPVAPPPQPEVIDPFVDYAYTGTIKIGDQSYALVENTKTKEGLYVKVGDQLIGGTVTEVTERGITVNVAGTPRTLAKLDNYNLTPLDKDAPFRTAQPQGGMPGMPGMPGGMPGMMPGMPGGGMGFPGMGNIPADVQQRIMQRFQGMTPEQLQEMRNRFMNRSFEGGQRRRRFF